MAQHDYVIDNQASASARADLNLLFQAIASHNSGATAPATTIANMMWYDTTADQLKMRNEANTAWITLGTSDQALNTFTAQSVNGKTVGTLTAAGGIAYATSTSALAAIGAGTSGQVLVSGGVGAPTWGATLNIGTAVAASGSSITFSGIPSRAKRIMVMLNAVSMSGSDNILVRIGSGSTSTTGYASGTGNAQSGGTTTVALSSLGYIVGVGVAGKSMHGIMTICNVTGNTWVASGVDYAESTGTDSMGTFAGTKTLTGILDRVSIDVSGTNTFDAGTVNIMWD